MGSKLSSELLFHFTRSLKNLNGIIINGFEHRPIPEDLPLTGYDNTIFSFPGIIIHQFKFYAVCFSDIPFRFIRDHIDQYGEYGIAMTKDWAIENKITPIRYVHYNTPEFKTDSFYNILNSLRFMRESDGRMSKLFATILEDKKTCEKFSEDDWHNLPDKFKTLIDRLDGNCIDIFNYFYKHLGLLRKYKGPWKDRKTGIVSERLFYDEKEWRSIKTKNEQSNLLFEYKDFKKIYVKNNKEKEFIISSIVENKHRFKLKNDEDIYRKIFLIDEELKNNYL